MIFLCMIPRYLTLSNAAVGDDDLTQGLTGMTSLNVRLFPEHVPNVELLHGG